MDLTFERVFASPIARRAHPAQVKLSPDGRYLTVLRNPWSRPRALRSVGL